MFISEALIGEFVGLAELDTGDYVVRFCDLDIGIIDRRGRFGRIRLRPVRGFANRPKPAAAQKLSGINIMPVQHVDHQPG